MVAGKLAQPGGVLDATAKKHHATMAQLALAWLLHRSKVILPIPGTSTACIWKRMLARRAEMDANEWNALEQKVKE